ncbi:MAG: hypothetical protein WAL22_10845 [Solirubrobacteraceae bacterium]
MRAGDEEAFREQTKPFRRELQVHIYRIDGSARDADDLLQETVLTARRGLEGCEGRVGPCPGCSRARPTAPRAARATRRRPKDLQRINEMPESTR